ncbi:MAG TPA: glutathione S-transferase family protein [Gammaproteobacteria bacterium]
MNQMVNGEWTAEPFQPRLRDGAYARPDSQFRDTVTADGRGGFAAEAGRYHLYVSLACPWAHRTLIVRRLKGLEEAVSVSVVHPYMGERGWQFDPTFPGSTVDHVNGVDYLYDVYRLARPDYSGIITVPVLWDRERRTIVNNESSEIIRMLNAEFGGCGAHGPDLYPQPLRAEIDALNERVYADVNNGVYRAGFATRQASYARAVTALFATLDELEQRLAGSRYLLGAQPTEADWRLFTTLVRFDAVYYGHFKCNLKRLVDYPNLWAYTRDLYQQPGIAATVDLAQIKHHYYASHPRLNPSGIVPLGPGLDFLAAHGRG